MSKVDELKDKIKNPKKPTAAKILMGGNEEGKVTVDETPVTNEDVVIHETAATEETDNTEKGIVKSAAVSKAFSGDTTKPEKKLKGIYIDADVLAVYEEEAKKPERGRGWGSQLVSDLLREVFEQQGLMPKK